MKRRRPQSKLTLAEAPAPEIIETFYPLSAMAVTQQPEPSCMNGMVRVHRWRITIERIEEPPEVIAERLRKLWKENRNVHHSYPLRPATSKESSRTK